MAYALTYDTLIGLLVGKRKSVHQTVNAFLLHRQVMR